MYPLKDKVALITGSTTGLGKAIAERYAKLGANIVLNDPKDIASADRIIAELNTTGVKAIAIQADISKSADVERLFSEAKKAFGKIDIVVANAGIQLANVPVTDLTDEQLDLLLSVNTKGTYLTLKNAAKHVEDNGRIIAISSTTAFFPVEGFSLYGGSKRAVNNLVEVLAMEIGHRGITVNTIVPFAVQSTGLFAQMPETGGFVDFAKAHNPMKRMAQTEDVANAAELLASDLASFISGQHLIVNGGARQ